MQTAAANGTSAGKQVKAPSYLEIVLAMITKAQGITAIRKMRPHPSKTVLLRAAHNLAGRGANREAKSLRAYCEEMFPARHFVKTKIGFDDPRLYRVQEQDGQFVRVPVELFKLQRKQLVRVYFTKDAKTGKVYFVGCPADQAEDS